MIQIGATPVVPTNWAEIRKTHPAVALAIHAIADDTRSAELIWDDPTPDEWDNVTMAVEGYLNQGDFAYETNGLYPWGQESIHFIAPDDCVETGAGEDYDTGHVVEIDGDIAVVAWDSGVRTPCPITDLTILKLKPDSPISKG